MPRALTPCSPASAGIPREANEGQRELEQPQEKEQCSQNCRPPWITCTKRQADEGSDGQRDDEDSDYCVGRAEWLYVLDRHPRDPGVRDLVGHRNEPG